MAKNCNENVKLYINQLPRRIVPIHKTISIESEEFWEECHKCARRENKALSTIIMEKLKEYIKIHGEGNPVYVLDKWCDNPDFKAVPAALESKEKWIEYCKRCPDETLREIEYAGMVMGIIARAYMKINPKDRVDKNFPDIRSMEKFWNNG